MAVDGNFLVSEQLQAMEEKKKKKKKRAALASLDDNCLQI